MALDKTIFGLRFGANDQLTPLQEDLRSFLESPKEGSGKALHGEDFAAYNAMLESINALGHDRVRGMASENLRAKIFYSILEHVSFFDKAFKSAVEQYKYHLHELKTIDFKKPTGFIKSAKEEISRLNPNKKEEAARLARLREMVTERRRTLVLQQKRREALSKELNNIALYIRDNLVKIEKLCGASVDILGDSRTASNETNLIIEEIKAYFKENLKDTLRNGQLTKKDLEQAKKYVEMVTGEMSELVKDDLGSIVMLYRSVQHHVSNAVHTIDVLTAQIEENQDKSINEYQALFIQLESALVSIISAYRFELVMRGSYSANVHGNILDEKRKEMLDRVLELLRKERRSLNERRYIADRRRFRDPNYTGPERRRGKDRRAEKRRIDR